MVKGKGIAASNATTHIDIGSSDSDSEGFFDDKGPNSVNYSGKPSTTPVNDNSLPSPKANFVGKATNSSKMFGKVSEKSPIGGSKSVNKRVSFDTPKSGVAVAEPEIPTNVGGKDSSSRKDGGKSGGKGGSGTKGTKVPVYDAELKLELELLEGSRVLMDSEAAEMLRRIQEQLRNFSADEKIKMPESFNKAFHHSESGCLYSDNQSARKILEDLKMYGVTEGEICMIGNACPETVDEAYSLIPSLKGLRWQNEGPLKDALSRLALFRFYD